MNRLTITIDFSDDVIFSESDIPKFLDNVLDVLKPFNIQPNLVDGIKGFQEIKKHYYAK